MVNERIWTLLTRKLSGEASATELEELQLLLSRNPYSAQMIQQVSEWWAGNHEADEEFLEATYLQHIERMKARGVVFVDDEDIQTANLVSGTPIRFRPLKVIAVSVIAIIAGLTSWVMFTSKESAYSEKKIKPVPAAIVAQHGARTRILLPDGSTVWLNGGSKLEYSKRFAKDTREVYLKGEAFFDVVKNPKRPFIIHTAKMDVRVLGTRFNVKAYEDDATTETSLIRGSVEVFLKNKPSEKYLLKPNEKLVLQNNPLPSAEKNTEKQNIRKSPVVEIKELTYINGSEKDVETSWTRNILSFEDESFLDVAHKMERWYDVNFEFKNKKWEKQYLRGSFENETLEQAMTALKFSNGFNYRIEKNKVTIY